MDGRPNRKNKAAFSESSAVVWTGPQGASSSYDTREKSGEHNKCIVKTVSLIIAAIAAKRVQRSLRSLRQ